MKKVKIYGAGSIGNHLSRAFRTIGYEVFVCDTDKAALERMKNEIYPSRYGAWDGSPSNRMAVGSRCRVSAPWRTMAHATAARARPTAAISLMEAAPGSTLRQVSPCDFVSAFLEPRQLSFQEGNPY